jgi:hypothetical protein
VKGPSKRREGRGNERWSGDGGGGAVAQQRHLVAAQSFSAAAMSAPRCPTLNSAQYRIPILYRWQMRGEIPPGVAALLEELDRLIEESRALRVELREKTAERQAVDQTIHAVSSPDTSDRKPS